MVVIGRGKIRTDGKERRNKKENQKKSAASAVGEEEGGRGLSKLPTDLLMEILSRLPIHSLLRCKAVCVAWRKIVRDRKFAQLQHVQAIRKHNQLDDNNLSVVVTGQGMLAGENKELHLVEGGMTTKAESTKITFQLNCIWLKELNASLHQIKVVGSYNGILCLAIHCCDQHPIACICNPITGEYMNLPTKIKPHSSFPGAIFGFGFDAVKQDYKVVMTYPASNCGDYPYETDICSVGRDDSWRRVGYFPAKLSPNFSSDVLVNGALHWKELGRDFFYRTNERFIIAMDMSSEQFYRVPPPKLSWRKFILFRLCNIMGNLSLVSFPTENRCVIWEMKEYMVQESWAKRVVHMPLKRSFHRLITHIALQLRHSIRRYGNFSVPFTRYSATNHVGSLISLEDAIGGRKKGKDSSVKIQNQRTELALDSQP